MKRRAGLWAEHSSPRSFITDDGGGLFQPAQPPCSARIAHHQKFRRPRQQLPSIVRPSFRKFSQRETTPIICPLSLGNSGLSH